jgi:TonB-linked SusC/RagA family outer membrane protein
MKKLLLSKGLYLLVFFSIVCTGLLAQQKIVKGTITDEAGKPLQGVSVTVKNSKQQTITNQSGTFSINLPAAIQTLVLSFTGMETKEVTVSTAQVNVSVTLKLATSALEDVVVIAYGKQKQATVTGAISTVSGKELVATSVSNISNMLVGNAPGVNGLQTSGEPGRNDAKIYIRGISTFTGSSNPLIVVDGIEQPAEQAYTRMNSMDPNEIDNISILKDASATAVYGIRGANGVIIITTKRGKLGKPSISLSSSIGFTKATNLMHNVSSYQWALMRNEAIKTEQSTFANTTFNPYVFDNTDLWKMQNNRDYTPDEVAAMTQLSDKQKAQLNASPALYYGSRDLFAEQFGGVGPQQQLNLNVSGGTAKVKYYTSMGYYNQGSIMNNTKYYGANTASTFNRYNFLSNFDIDLVKNLQVKISISGQFGKTAGPGYSGTSNPYDYSSRYKAIMQYIFDSNPLTAPGIVDGHMINSYQGVGGSASNPLGIKLGSQKGNQNAIRNLLVSGTETLYNTLLNSSIVLTHTMGYLTKGLSAHATVNYGDSYNKAVAYTPSLPDYSVRRDPLNPNILDFFGGATGASGFNSDPGYNSVWRNIYVDAGIDYSRTFGAHTVTGLVVGKATKYTQPSDSYNTPSGSMGLVGRATYNYKERYLAEVNIGYTGTEEFIESKRFGLFPAYSAGWVISKESFFPKNNWFTYLKVRASYGETGNDQYRINGNVQRYLYLPSTYLTGQGGYYWGTSNGSVVNPYWSGSVEGSLGNPDITWERAISKNIGIEARFLSDRLTFTADIFQQDRNNILTAIQTIPAVYGVSSSSVPPANVGKTTNHGYEMVVKWAENKSKFSYYINGSLSYARNKIVYMAESNKAYPWMMQTGFPIGQYTGLVADGFFNTPDEINNAPYNTNNANKVALGDVRYKDINGDGKIDVKDIVPIGYSNLAQYTFNLKLGFSYKGFDVSMLFTGQAKGSFNLARYEFTNGSFFQNAGNVMQWMYDGRWTADKVAKNQQILYPRATMNGGTGGSANYSNSTLWLISNDFKRLKNMEIGYTLSPSIPFLQRAKISAVRIYVNGNNLCTWGSALLDKGIDPEASDSGGYAIYPITRVFVFGAQVRF